MIESVTDELNRWIKEYGSERDALNVAIAKLHIAEKLCAALKEEASQPAQDDHINSAVKHIGDVDDMPPLVDFLMHPEDN
jgi:hypothetical protein